MFTTTVKSIGHVKVGTTHTIYFEYDKFSKIEQSSSPCDCAHPVDEPANKRIKVTYKAGPVPRQIKAKGFSEYAIKKFIRITWTDEIGRQQVTELTFTGIVHE